VLHPVPRVDYWEASIAKVVAAIAAVLLIASFFTGLTAR
jgi:hypothetical protein